MGCVLEVNGFIGIWLGQPLLDMRKMRQLILRKRRESSEKAEVAKRKRDKN